MKIIFLDIDWVLIKFWNSYKIRKTRSEKWQSWTINSFDLDLVENLKYIISKTNAKIVISSSWRHDMDRVEKAFKKAWLNSDLIVWSTPVELWYWRWNEVLTYILENLKNSRMFEDVIENFVMIDDDNFDAKCVIRLWKFVHTKTNIWLNKTKAKEAIRILNS